MGNGFSVARNLHVDAPVGSRIAVTVGLRLIKPNADILARFVGSVIEAETARYGAQENYFPVLSTSEHPCINKG
jgi:hypothetical protein